MCRAPFLFSVVRKVMTLFGQISGGGHLSLTHHHRPPPHDIPHDIPHHIDRLEHRLRRQVRVAHRHLRVVVSEELLHLVQRPPGIDQETRVAVAQVVQS